jgi:ABC-type glutathione transport system ATPase component
VVRLLCDRVIVMHAGRIVATGRPAEVLFAPQAQNPAVFADPQQLDWMLSQELGISCGDHPRRTQLRSIDPNASPAKMVHG